MSRWSILIGASALSIAGGAAWLLHSQPSAKMAGIAAKPIPVVIDKVQASHTPIA